MQGSSILQNAMVMNSMYVYNNSGSPFEYHSNSIKKDAGSVYKIRHVHQQLIRETINIQSPFELGDAH